MLPTARGIGFDPNHSLRLRKVCSHFSGVLSYVATGGAGSRHIQSSILNIYRICTSLQFAGFFRFQPPRLSSTSQTERYEAGYLFNILHANALTLT
jgi:hypothetical protein